jgi:CitMHS family citrate-Mg2+:H+ or citrate-Ca2+:H+ symporter
MLTVIGLVAIASLLILILFRITSVLVALTLVPLAAAIAGGFAGQFGTFAMDGIRSVTPVAVLLAFAVIYFGVMNDAGLFEPAIRVVLRAVGGDPVRIVVGTAIVAMIAHLDGAGASTFMVTIPAMLPVYRQARMDPLVLTCATALSAGTMNMLPWGGPLSRAATALEVELADIFLPILPAMVAGLAAVLALAIRMGRLERARLARAQPSTDADSTSAAVTDERAPMPGDGPSSSRRIWYFNAILTVVTLAALFVEIVPLALTFVIASAMALVVNYPNATEQRERLTGHASAAMLMVTTIFAAGIFTGVLTRSGMLASLSSDLVRVLPDAALRHLPLVMAAMSMPLSLVFDPDSFYFGLLPVLAGASQDAGGSAIELGRAAVLGQMTTGFPVSPLTPATFLLIGLADVELGDHQRRTIPYAFGVTLIMGVVALATGALRV